MSTFFILLSLANSWASETKNLNPALQATFQGLLECRKTYKESDPRTYKDYVSCADRFFDPSLSKRVRMNHADWIFNVEKLTLRQCTPTELSRSAASDLPNICFSHSSFAATDAEPIVENGKVTFSIVGNHPRIRSILHD